MKDSSQAGPSSNWRLIKKTLPKSSHHLSDAHARKRRKLTPSGAAAASTPRSAPAASTAASTHIPSHLLGDTTIVNGERLGTLRAMIYAPQPYADTLPEKDRLPGTYVAIDCEMVGVGPAGSESSLARVSVVNYCGAVLLDVFVRQKERVTDWRTQWSGVRERDMVNGACSLYCPAERFAEAHCIAISFEDVQEKVAVILKDRVLIGHAIHNDLTVLMLSHSRAHIRDTQHLAHKHGQSRAPRPALRNLVRDMLGVSIQEGEHSSVIDARATMAVYRLHRKQWERAYSVTPIRVPRETVASKGKQKAEGAAEVEDEAPQVGAKRKRDRSMADGASDDDEEVVAARVKVKAKKNRGSENGRAPVQRKGVSSGLSTIVTRRGGADSKSRGAGEKSKWWTKLGK
ncbi:ribonuclease H-like protein [Artomyces pyxidatus]|uniref:Ribonuclease H-like protein n=1 Tax=Artomyces pyxidatus TaxID=48021 RepID=A0ACB8SPK1_9AGAM|nr:ribonuclease H-like protein [Artomyces pyxidatus]